MCVCTLIQPVVFDN